MKVKTPTYMSARTLTERWDCSEAKVHRFKRSGKLPAYKIGGSTRFKLSDVEALEQQQV